mmetsp:Transcript_21619/g.49904  ORF Transcript_21619/g.49904 Transcript_21619/m.49904 type:complete len:161 (+) Transcript_21619:324-806(+)|eukprot:CAMPEP_0116843752 /NCGR_PEP_ID=MMETSP0418-20121206/12268_1 /TAXON_ID=1158023 /ORGANISM="Astrosyne radiata, Strain 13vi08-1A" /LENGTH=160 /DNA_ID=CAMNT_0004474551 /DNA_START=267 /DNA_END=749 /DNA_ORIENTATION=-
MKLTTTTFLLFAFVLCVSKANGNLIQQDDTKFLEAFFRQEEEKERKMMEDMIAHLLVLEKEEKSRRLTEGGGEDDETYSGPLKFEGDFSTPEAEDEENLMDNPPFVIDEEDVDPTEGLAQMRAEEEDPELGEAEIRKEEQKTGRKQRSLLRQGGHRRKAK